MYGAVVNRPTHKNADEENNKECSVNHSKYKEGVQAGIKHGYYVDHQITCPKCEENLEGS